jgi:hypothetical protein
MLRALDEHCIAVDGGAEVKHGADVGQFAWRRRQEEEQGLKGPCVLVAGNFRVQFKDHAPTFA